MSKQYAYLHTMAKTSVQFQNDWPKPVGVALTRHALRFMCKQYAHLQTMTCSSVKFKNYWPKTAGKLRHETPADFKGFR